MNRRYDCLVCKVQLILVGETTGVALGRLTSFPCGPAPGLETHKPCWLSGVQLETNCAGLADHAAEREAIRLLAREVKSAFR